MKTFKVKEENILKRLAKKYDVTNVSYNILTGNFVYYRDGEKKHISLESLVNFMKYEEDKDVELYTLLNELESSYFDDRIKNYFTNFYLENELPLPRNIFITSGFIEFTDRDGEIFYLPYEDDLEMVLKQALKYIK